MKARYLYLTLGLFLFSLLSHSNTHAKFLAPATEVAVVEIIFGYHGPEDVSGIYISYPDGKAEKIDLLGDMGTENIEKNGMTIAKTLQGFLDNGWNLISSCGGDNSKRYIFSK
jgi:hypothetical protein